MKVVPDTQTPSESDASEEGEGAGEGTGEYAAMTDGSDAEQASARVDCLSNLSEGEERSSPAAATEPEGPVGVPAATPSQKSRSSAVEFLRYSRPGKRQVPLSVKAREALG